MSPRLALLFLAACGPKAPEVVPEAPASSAEAPAPPTEAPSEAASPVEAGAHRCGGFAGLRCPAGLQCVDDPTDSCVPGRGADCIGLCVGPGELPAVRRPVHDDPETCKSARFACEEGEVRYSDASGCGCQRDRGVR